MSAKRWFRQRLHGLQDIGEILGSMKTLAVIETRKLARFGAAQQRMVEGIERAAADFCQHYPYILEHSPAMTEVCLVLGSERGFCGDYNEALLAALNRLDQEQPAKERCIVAVGSRVLAKLGDNPRIVARLNGASAAEEVPSVLGETVDTVLALEACCGPLTLRVLHHGLETDQVMAKRLLPPFDHLAGQPPAWGYPPRIQSPVRQLLAELIEHFLFASLNEFFYTALRVENQRRIQHLEGAIQRLEQEIARLTLRINTLRQEEITEEIEVILISVQTEMD